MRNYEEEFILAKRLHLTGKIIESQKIYLRLIKKFKNNDKLFFLLGTTFLQLKNYNKAVNYLNISINLNEKFADSYNNIGIALAELKQYSKAIFNYDKAIKLKGNYIDAYLNKGISLNKLKKFDEAIKITEIVIKLNPLNAKAFNNLGNIFQNINKKKESVKAYNKAIKINSEYFEAMYNLAGVLDKLKLHEEALIYYYKIFNKDPNFDGLLGKIISSKMHIYDWDNFTNITNEIKHKIIKKKIIIEGNLITYLTDDLNLIKLNSESWILKEVADPRIRINENNDSSKFVNLKTLNKNTKKIKIGYFSAEFSAHVVLQVMNNIFKHHNKNKFELYAFSHGKKEDDLWRKKIRPYFKKFYIINDMNDSEVLRLARSEEIDIAINLTGLTENHRTGVFIKRVAPIQINYLGYPGTIGTKSIDYIIADKVVIPETEKKYYFEKVKYLPECYISESKDLFLKTTKNYKRLDFNLPQDKIVFCAIHNPLKINPKIFSVWMNIIKKVENSVLWISANTEKSKKNLLTQFKKNKINVDRIIFAEKVKENGDHLKRLELADIFLDTAPYNSHSTTYDYINAGLPMITLKGNSFPSRVATSIYSSLNIKELIAETESEYENIAIDLANDKIKLDKIKNKIKKNCKNSILFKSKEFTKELEKVYLEIFNENI